MTQHAKGVVSAILTSPISAYTRKVLYHFRDGCGDGDASIGEVGGALSWNGDGGAVSAGNWNTGITAGGGVGSSRNRVTLNLEALIILPLNNETVTALSPIFKSGIRGLAGCSTTSTEADMTLTPLVSKLYNKLSSRLALSSKLIELLVTRI